MEVSEYLVGSPAFKAGDTGDPRMAGSIPVHLRQIPPKAGFGVGATFRRGRNPSLAARSVVGICILIAMVLGLPGVAGSQVRLLSSTPENGDSLANVNDIRFEFDGLLISDAAASVTLIRTNGQSIPVTGITVEETVLRAQVLDDVTSGTYEIAYAVRSADGFLNEGLLRVTVDSPSQALSGGALAVVGIFFALFLVMFVVFTADKRRRPTRQTRGPSTP